MCDDPLPKGVCSTMHAAALESWRPMNLALLFVQCFSSCGRFWTFKTLDRNHGSGHGVYSYL